MPRPKKSAPAKPARKRAQTVSPRAKPKPSLLANAKPTKKGTQPSKAAQPSLGDQVNAVLASLKRLADKRVLEDMSKRYGIYTKKAFGVSMANIQKVAKPLGRNHELAAALWDTGWYEARMLTSFVDEPARVTSAQMDAWVRDFDNWGIVDTLCSNLFDRTPHAWRKVAQWCKQEDEFVKRAGFALLWSLTVHDKLAGDEQFIQGLVFVLRAASDERHFVKKAVNMALRAIGKRNPALNAAAVAVARRLADSPEPSARWVGKDALRELTSPGVRRRLAARRPAAEG
ncbi:MAG: DNA alkylation repair protein [Acidobacteriota bacterium]